MALTDPRIYHWNIGGREPFVENETSMYLRDSLRAADDHAIPFPRHLYESEHYWRADTIRVQLMMEDGDQPYPGVSYVMEINVIGRNLTLREHVRRQMERSLRGRTPASLGPGARAILGQMENPTDRIGGFTNWNARVRLIDVDSVEQVAGGGTRVAGRVREVTVRYAAITPAADVSWLDWIRHAVR